MNTSVANLLPDSGLRVPQPDGPPLTLAQHLDLNGTQRFDEDVQVSADPPVEAVR